MDLKLDYWVWIEHGEVLPPENQFNVGYVGSSLTRAHVGNEEGDNVTWEDNRSRYQGMIFDAAVHDFGIYLEPFEEVPNPDDERLYSLLGAVDRPLQEGYVHFQLSLAIRILSSKSEANQSQSSFDQWASLISEISPHLETIPKDYY